MTQIKLRFDIESGTLTDENGKPVEVVEVELIDATGEITFTQPEQN